MEVNYMDEAGINYHALVAVLYALQRQGIDLGAIRESVTYNLAGQVGIRPPPQDQEAVHQAIAQAISDIKR